MNEPFDSGVASRVVVITIAIVLIVVVGAILGLRALGVGQNRPPVLLLGDSITHNLNAPIKRELGGDYSFAVVGTPGAYATEMVGAAEDASRFPYQQAVVNLGTNDVNNPSHDLNTTVTALQQIVSTLSRFRCVHVVTISESMLYGDPIASDRARRLNEAIVEMVDQYPNASVIDWAEIVRDESGNGEPLTTDTVHPSERGNEELSNAYGDALADCPAPA